MREIERKIYVSETILLNEYDYVYGRLKDTFVSFTYYNVKKDRVGTSILGTYSYCLSLARSRAGDGRYKNFEYLINVI